MTAVVLMPPMLVTLAPDKETWHFYEGPVMVGSRVRVWCGKIGTFDYWNPARDAQDGTKITEGTAEYMEKKNYSVCFDCFNELLV